MAEVLDGEGAITSARIAELRLDLVEGNYDAAPLREAHRRIFQDLPHHHPGAYRPDLNRHRKTRALEAVWKVGHSGRGGSSLV